MCIFIYICECTVSFDKSIDGFQEVVKGTKGIVSSVLFCLLLSQHSHLYSVLRANDL